MEDIEFSNILNKERDQATCNVIKVGDIKMMFDVGCDEKFTIESVSQVLRHI